MSNYFLSKTKIPQKLPDSMQKVVDRLKRTASQEECLKMAYDIMVERFKTHRFKAFGRIPEIFTFDIERLWDNSDFKLCHNLTYMLRILLVKSGHFNNEDLRAKWTQVWYISPHNFLIVKMKSGKTVNVDVWGADEGVKFGEYAHGFH